MDQECDLNMSRAVCLVMKCFMCELVFDVYNVFPSPSSPLCRSHRRLSVVDAVLDPDRSLSARLVLSVLRPPAAHFGSDPQIHLPLWHRQHSHSVGITECKKHYITHILLYMFSLFV